MVLTEKQTLQRAHQKLESGDALEALLLMHSFIANAEQFKHFAQREFILAMTNEAMRVGIVDFTDEDDVLAKAFDNDGELLYSLGRIIMHSAPFRARRCLARAYLRSLDNDMRIKILHDFYSVSTLLLDSWHMRMINDKRRNFAFSAALNKLMQGSGRVHNVLDIGAGTGILSLMAARHAESVVGLEFSSSTFPIFEENVSSPRPDACTVVPLHMMSTEYVPANERPFDIIISETLDAAALGENIISTMLDAHRLASSTVKFCPSHLTIYVQLMHSLVFFQSETAIHPADQRRCFANGREDEESMNDKDEEERSRPPGGHYTTIRLRDFPDHQRLSERIEILKVEFGNKENLEELLGDYSFNVDIPITGEDGGTIHGILVSFKATLAPGVELDPTSVTDKMMKRDPLPNDEEPSWDHAVYPRLAGRRVAKGDTFSLRVRVVNGQIAFPEDPTPDHPVLKRDPIYHTFPDGFLTWANNAEVRRFIGTERILKWIASMPERFGESRYMDDLLWPLRTDGCLFNKGILDMRIQHNLYHRRHTIPEGTDQRRSAEKYAPIVRRMTCKAVLFSNRRLDQHCRFQVDNHAKINIESASSPIVEYREIRAPFRGGNYAQLSDPYTIFTYEGQFPERLGTDDLLLETYKANFQVVVSGPADGLLYWWVVEHADSNIKAFDTRAAELPMAAAMFPERINVEMGEILPITVHDFVSSYLALAGSDKKIYEDSIKMAKKFAYFSS